MRKMGWFDHLACLILGAAALAAFYGLLWLWYSVSRDNPLLYFLPILIPASYGAGRLVKYLIETVGISRT